MGLVCTSSSNSYWTDLEQKQKNIYKQKKINKNKTKNKNKRKKPNKTKNKQTKDKRKQSKGKKNKNKNNKKRKKNNKKEKKPRQAKHNYLVTTKQVMFLLLWIYLNSWTNFIVWRQITFSWMVKNIRCWILFFVVWHWPTKSTNICMSRIIMNVQNTVRSFIMDFPIFTQVYIFT